MGLIYNKAASPNLVVQATVFLWTSEVLFTVKVNGDFIYYLINISIIWYISGKSRVK